MKISVKTLTIAGTTILLGGNLSAVIPEKYQTILDRNAFGLLPPPPPPSATNDVVAPPANLKVIGFATIAGERRVFFTIPPKDAAKELQQYISLSEGQRQGSLEVVSIGEAEGEVRIRNGGVDMVLSLKKDGFQPAKVAPGMNQQPMPLAPPPPGAQAGSPVYSPESAGAVVATPAMQQASGNPNPPMVDVNQQGIDGSVQPGAAPGAVRTIPTRTLRVPPVQPGSPSPQSSINTGNSVVYNPVPPSVGNNNSGGSDFEDQGGDPAMQLAANKQFQDMANRNGGIPIEIQNRTPNPVVSQPPHRTYFAPPPPPLPQ